MGFTRGFRYFEITAMILFFEGKKGYEYQECNNCFLYFIRENLVVVVMEKLEVKPGKLMIYHINMTATKITLVHPKRNIILLFFSILRKQY